MSPPENWEHSGHFAYCSDLVSDDFLPGCGRGSCIFKQNSTVSDVSSAHSYCATPPVSSCEMFCFGFLASWLPLNWIPTSVLWATEILTTKRNCCEFPGVEPRWEDRRAETTTGRFSFFSGFWLSILFWDGGWWVSVVYSLSPSGRWLWEPTRLSKVLIKLKRPRLLLTPYFLKEHLCCLLLINTSCSPMHSDMGSEGRGGKLRWNCQETKVQMMIKVYAWAECWRHGSVLKSTCLQWASVWFPTPTCWFTTLCDSPSGLLDHQAHTWNIYINACKTLIYIK